MAEHGLSSLIFEADVSNPHYIDTNYAKQLVRKKLGKLSRMVQGGTPKGVVSQIHPKHVYNELSQQHGAKAKTVCVISSKTCRIG